MPDLIDFMSIQIDFLGLCFFLCIYKKKDCKPFPVSTISLSFE